MSETTYAVHTATCTYLLDEDGVCRWTYAPVTPVTPADARPRPPALGVAPPGAERCVGAQFVACLDLRTEGGLVGELRLGASALFARDEGGRLVLLRTLPIESVEIRAAPLPSVEDPSSFGETPILTPMPLWEPELEPILDPRGELGSAPAAPNPESPLPAFDPQTEPFPAFPFNPEETEVLDPRWSSPGEALDLEDLLSISVTEVTLSLPLYPPGGRPRAAPPARAPLPPPNPPPVSRRPSSAPPPAPAPAPAAPPHRPPRRSVIGPGRRLR